MATTTAEMGMGMGGGGLVVTELSHIKELVRQLEVHLGGSPDLCKHLASQIFSLTERSIGLMTSSNLDYGASPRRKRSAGDAAGLASPLAAATPTSDVTADGPFKSTKKRKVMEQRRHRVSSAAGENPVVDDGHSWRKYGQKEILGAKNPRSYYRCTHRHSQGCPATKQVQRTDEDATLYDVIYHGEHTCTAAATAAAAEHNPDARAHLQTLSAGLTVKTEGLPAAAASTPPSLLHLSSASTPAASGGCQVAPSTTSENWGAVVSPATSDSNNHVAASAYYLPFDGYRGHAELQEVVSALVAASAPPPPQQPLPLPHAVDSIDDLHLFDIDDFVSYFA